MKSMFDSYDLVDLKQAHTQAVALRCRWGNQQMGAKFASRWNSQMRILKERKELFWIESFGMLNLFYFVFQ